MHESTLSGNYHATVMDMNWYNLEAINIKEEFERVGTNYHKSNNNVKKHEG